jgi:hypothetical protein
MINGLGAIAAINTAMLGLFVQGLSPASDTQLGAEILKEDRIPDLHSHASVADSLPLASDLSMCRRLHFFNLIAKACSPRQVD